MMAFTMPLRAGQMKTLDPSTSSSIECGRVAAGSLRRRSVGAPAALCLHDDAGTKRRTILLRLAARFASPREQLLRRQAVAARNLAGPNAILEALGDDRRLLFAPIQLRRRPAPVKISIRRAGRLPLRHVLML